MESKGDGGHNFNKEVSKPEGKRIIWSEMGSLLKDDSKGEKVIKNPFLTRLVKLLSTADEKRLAGKNLRAWLDEGDKRWVLGDVSKEEWEIVAGVIAERLDKLAGEGDEDADLSKTLGESLEKSGEKTVRAIRDLKNSQEKRQQILAGEREEEVPDDEEKQRIKLIMMVEKIENNNLPLTDYRNTDIAGRIGTMIEDEKVNEDLRKECMARLRLRHCSAIADAIPPGSKLAKEFLIESLTNPESRYYVLQGDDFDLLLRKGLPGLKVAEAFKLLEKASTLGREIIDEKGKKVRKTLMDESLSLSQRETILRSIIENLGGGKEAKKSLQLAQRIAKATLETSVWNVNILGNDPLSEIIYFKNYRFGRAKTARDKGPLLTISRIEGFGSSFFRSAKNFDQKMLFMPNEDLKKINKESDDSERINRLLLRNRGRDDGGKLNKNVGRFERFLDIDEMEFTGIAPDSYLVWLGLNLPRLFFVKDLLLKTHWEPQDFNSDAIESWAKPISVVDPEEILGLRVEFVAGAFWSIFSRPSEAMNSGWDGFSLQAVIKNLTRSFEIKDEEGREKEISFLDQDRRNFVIKYLKNFGINIYHEAAKIGTKIRYTKRFIGR